MKSDAGKLYIKIVVLSEIYNFVVDKFWIENYLQYEIKFTNIKFKVRISQVVQNAEYLFYYFIFLNLKFNIFKMFVPMFEVI